MKYTFTFVLIGLLFISPLFAQDEAIYPITKEEAEWKEQLSPEAYEVLRNKATERAFTGEYYDFYEKGGYHCLGCGAELFSSQHKYYSGCGWPSFYDLPKDAKIETKTDYSYGMVRTEVLCSQCGGHLGHVFNDSPYPTGTRYCINSVALEFRPKEKRPIWKGPPRLPE